MLGLRLGKPLGGRLAWMVLACVLTVGFSAITAGTAAAGGPPGRFHRWFHHPKSPHSSRICTGTPEAPGTLAGTYFGNVSIEGVCAVNGGKAVIFGNLVVHPNSALLAAFALNDQTGTGTSSLSVVGDLRVQEGATALLGCEAEHFACIDDPAPEAPTLSSQTHVFGNLQEQQPLGVVMHDSVIGGDLRENGGGGGETCEPSGVFAVFGSPVYSDYEDTAVYGNLDIRGLSSCWLGVARVHVQGDARFIGDQLADPDAIEIIANNIGGNLACRQNSQVWDSADEGESLYPRAAEPNTVDGRRSGDCVLASAATEGGPLGPGAF